MFLRPVHLPRRKPRSGKHLFRLFATGALVVSASAAAGPAAAQVPRPAAERSSPALKFDIPAGPLDEALRTYEAVTGLALDVTLPPDVLSMMQSPGVAGVMDPRRALDRLLEGTSLGVRTESDGRLVVDVAAVRESVEVTGRMPGVTSPKLTEPLRDIPQTITVIPRAVMEAQAATTLRDVLRNVAGITFQAGEGGVPAGDQLSIRGFSARTDMFVDGVRDFGGYSRDSFNMEQVEVAKGPTSAIAGRGSTGGAINQVSKAPTDAPVLDATFGAGSASYQRSTIDINQPVKDSPIPGLAVRLNAMWTDTDVPNRDYVSSERWGIAPSVALGLGGRTRATISYFKLAQDNLPEYGLPWVPANTNPALEAYANGAPLLTSPTSTVSCPATTRRRTPTSSPATSRTTSGPA
ncbi:MAG: TonB-dependent receptor plug domain-containing protein [Vicinamibacterales bacterium]